MSRRFFSQSLRMGLLLCAIALAVPAPRAAVAVRPPRNVLTLDTAADLEATDWRAVSAAGAATVVLRGWQTVGDGRGGQFVLHPTNTLDPTNALDTLAARSNGVVTGRWKKESQGNRSVATLAELDRLVPAYDGEPVMVGGYSAAGDWDRKTFWYRANATGATNDICRLPSTGVGRWEDLSWDGDPASFGAFSYPAPYTDMPWGYKTNINAIGTGDFSVWIRANIPTGFTNPVGLFSIGPATVDTNLPTGFLLSSFGFRASSTAFGFLFRATNASSSVGGSLTSDAALLDTVPATFSSILGTTADIVFTRSGTSARVYINGNDVTSSFTNYNSAGWAKSLGTGVQLLVSSGNNDSMWYWPDVVPRFALWTNALSPSQATNPIGTTGKIIDFTAEYQTLPTDAGPRLNAAIAELARRGGGTIPLHSGGYRISTPIIFNRNVTLRGKGVAYYPNVTTFVEGNLPAGTTLHRWFDLEDYAVKARRDDFKETFMTLRQANGVSSYTNSTAWVRTASARIGIKDLCISGRLNPYGAGGGILLDRVGSVTIENVGFVHVPGQAIYSVQANALEIRGVSGSGGRGINIRGIADGEFSNSFYDGAMGPALWIVGNLNTVANLVGEYSLNPRDGAASWEKVTTVNAASDTFTTSARHKFMTGDVIRFVTDTGTLPSPLREDVDYFVYRIDGFSYKVGLKHSDEIGRDGVMDGAGFLDITTTGSGTWYGGPGPSCGFLVQGDNLSLIGARSASNYEDGLRLENCRDVRVLGGRFLMAGNLNTNLSAIAAIQMFGTTDSSIIGCTTDDRNNATGYSLIGIKGDSNSTKNVFFGNSIQSTTPGWTPYQVAEDNEIFDGAGKKLFTTRSGVATMLIPSVAGLTPYAEPLATNNAKPAIYDTSDRRFKIARDATSGNWDYMPTYPYSGPIYWNSVVVNGAQNGANSGAGAIMFQMHGTGFSPLMNLEAYSTTASLGPILGFLRNHSGTFGVYGAVTNGQQLGRIQFGGYYSNNASSFTRQAVQMNPIVTEDWETGKLGSKLDVYVVRNGSSASSLSVRMKSDGRINLPPQSADPITDLEIGDLYVNSITKRLRIYTGTNGFGAPVWQEY